MKTEEELYLEVEDALGRFVQLVSGNKDYDLADWARRVTDKLLYKPLSNSIVETKLRSFLHSSDETVVLTKLESSQLLSKIEDLRGTISDQQDYSRRIRQTLGVPEVESTLKFCEKLK